MAQTIYLVKFTCDDADFRAHGAGGELIEFVRGLSLLKIPKPWKILAVCPAAPLDSQPCLPWSHGWSDGCKAVPNWNSR